MLKRVPVAAVELGMFIHEPDGAWIDYPEWKTRFLLTDPADLAAIRESKIAQFIIDVVRGIDVAPEPEAAPRPAPRASSAIRRTAIKPLPATCSAEEEFGRAAAVAKQAGSGVQRLLREARLGKAVDVKRTVPIIEAIAQSLDRNPSALISYARIKSTDSYTYMHSVAVCALMISLGRQLLFDESALEDLGAAGLMHDIGKATVPPELITKPGKLTAAEMAIMRQHAVRGHELLSRTRGVSDVVLDTCLHHHERVDGTGYPHGLTGDQISLPTRMAAVCDVYDAVTSMRPYREADQPAETLAVMFDTRGHFDDAVLAAFIRSVGIYPLGSLVRLRSGRLAVIIEQNEAKLTRPTVRAFYSIARRSPIACEVIELADGSDEILSRERPDRWGFSDWDRMWPALLQGGGASIQSAA